ncbi:MAG: hypothetical protein SFX72_19845 [Isosphaeraceae bacterium]|nr:hypothetical protein [Isosphaeraceae bacterium]
MFDRIRRYLGSTPRSVRGADRTRFQPVADRLEPRRLQAILGVWAFAAPQKLAPNGKFVPVLVTGEVTTSRLNETPVVRYRVVDQYAQVQPKGRVQLTEKAPGNFIFNFTVKLQARQSRTFTSARLYSIVVGYEDSENGAGKTLPVIVPRIG